jgi:hypothetical protein
VSERRLVLTAVAATLLMAMAGIVLLGSQGSADASSLSRAASGWLAARRYLEETGTRVALIDHDLDEPPGRGVLVLAFPWQRLAFEDTTSAVERQLQQGGAVLLAYTDHPDDAETDVGRALGLSWQDRRPPPPLRPRAWWAYASEEWTLAGEPPDGPREVRITALRRAPGAPPAATVLLRDGRGRPVAFSFPRRRGRVVVLPADVFANARLLGPGNADLLETLRRDLGDAAWLFDEFHHGLRAEPGPAVTGPQRILLLYVLQIAFLYGLCALAVVRRFGPAWRDEAVPGGSAATFLIGLGTLHDRLGHHGEAARRLVARAQELDPRLTLASPPVAGGRELLALARQIGAAQSRKDDSA